MMASWWRWCGEKRSDEGVVRGQRRAGRSARTPLSLPDLLLPSLTTLVCSAFSAALRSVSGASAREAWWV